jgi:hypothetical protein
VYVLRQNCRAAGWWRESYIILQELQVAMKIITSYFASAKKMYVQWLGKHFLGRNEETRGGSLSSLRCGSGFQIGIGKEEGVRRSTITLWLLAPHKEPSIAAEVAYNNLHKTERVIIKRCFGQLKHRFPILQSPIQ